MNERIMRYRRFEKKVAILKKEAIRKAGITFAFLLIIDAAILHLCWDPNIGFANLITSFMLLMGTLVFTGFVFVLSLMRSMKKSPECLDFCLGLRNVDFDDDDDSVHPSSPIPTVGAAGPTDGFFQTGHS